MRKYRLSCREEIVARALLSTPQILFPFLCTPVPAAKPFHAQHPYQEDWLCRRAPTICYSQEQSLDVPALAVPL